MSAVFAAKGASGGAAPRTIWMSALADTLTCATKWNEAVQSGESYVRLAAPYNVPLLLANQWLPYNCSFGASTTAPDGTSNATHITEDTSNGNHYIGCGYGNRSTQPGLKLSPTFNIAGIYKAAERTRICFELFDLAFAHCFVGFDLVGGQIAYGPTSAGDASIVTTGASIAPVPGFPGWYLCIFTAYSNSNFNPIYLRTYLDNGSGTAAKSISYTGDGASGVIGWKTSMLPVQAWRIGGISFVNNFANTNDLNRIDINNTKLPGYDFYYQCESWTNWQGITASTPSSSNLVSGVPPPGTLQIVPDAASSDGFSLLFPAGPKSASGDTTSNYEWTIGFASETGPMGRGGSGTSGTAGTFVGRGFVPPYLLEWSYRFQVQNQAADGSNSDIWGMVLETQATVASSNPNKYLTGGDISLAEALPYAHSESNFQCGSETLWQDFNSAGYQAAPGVRTSITSPPHLGCFPFYSSNLSLHNSGLGGGPYEFNGSYYTNANSATTGPPPGGPWVPYTYGIQNITGNNQPPVKIDLVNTFQKMGALYVPYDPISGAPGCSMIFHNGNFTSMIANAWTPAALTDNPYYHHSDWEQRNWWWNPGSVSGSGMDFNFDYIRVWQ